MSKTKTTRRSVDRDLLLRAFKEVGANSLLPEVIDEADEIVAMIQYVPNYGILILKPRHFTVFSSADRGSYVPAEWFVILLVGLLPVVWIAGLVFFLRIRSKRLVVLSASTSV